ncbi:unnamed protein product [Caenorhabditis brenneri]
MSIFFSSYLLVFSLFCLFFNASSTRIETSLGPIEGQQIGNFHVFKKIPFARPPIGKLRFQKPEPHAPWKDVLNAKEYGPACMSNSSTTKTIQKWVDEDCLHINIFTSENCLKSKNCAVVNYVHGGALHYDSAVMFNDTVLFNNFVSKDIVFVLPAFRLGIFSHFVVEDQSIAPNNLALFDILFAFEFVKSNIRKFGGDSNKVTLLGHSYGGTVAEMLSFSTEVNTDLSLFQQYIAMSSSNNFDSLEFQMEKTLRFAEHANCLPKKSKHILTNRQKELYMRDCLQGKDAMELLRLHFELSLLSEQICFRIQRKLEEENFPTYGELVLRGPLFQEVPERNFMDTPKKVSALTGCTKYEVLSFHNFDDIGKSLLFDNPEEVDEKYKNDKKNGLLGFPNVKDETQEMFVQTKTRVDKLRKHGIPAYLYEYSYPKHAEHTDDLFYIMGVHPFEQDENEKNLGDVYRNMFVNFIKTGKPGNGFEMTDLSNSSYYEVYWNETTGARPQMKNDFEKEVCLEKTKVTYSSF